MFESHLRYQKWRRMLRFIKNLRYLFGTQCENLLGETRCRRRKGHAGWHTENGNMYWGDTWNKIARE